MRAGSKSQAGPLGWRPLGDPIKGLAGRPKKDRRVCRWDPPMETPLRENRSSERGILGLSHWGMGLFLPAGGCCGRRGRRGRGGRGAEGRGECLA